MTHRLLLASWSAGVLLSSVVSSSLASASSPPDDDIIVPEPVTLQEYDTLIDAWFLVVISAPTQEIILGMDNGVRLHDQLCALATPDSSTDADLIERLTEIFSTGTWGQLRPRDALNMRSLLVELSCVGRSDTTNLMDLTRGVVVWRMVINHRIDVLAASASDEAAPTAGETAGGSEPPHVSIDLPVVPVDLRPTYCAHLERSEESRIILGAGALFFPHLWKGSAAFFEDVVPQLLEVCHF